MPGKTGWPGDVSGKFEGKNLVGKGKEEGKIRMVRKSEGKGKKERECGRMKKNEMEQIRNDEYYGCIYQASISRADCV